VPWRIRVVPGSWKWWGESLKLTRALNWWRGRRPWKSQGVKFWNWYLSVNLWLALDQQPNVYTCSVVR